MFMITRKDWDILQAVKSMNLTLEDLQELNNPAPLPLKEVEVIDEKPFIPCGRCGGKPRLAYMWDADCYCYECEKCGKSTAFFIKRDTAKNAWNEEMGVNK